MSTKLVVLSDTHGRHQEVIRNKIVDLRDL